MREKIVLYIALLLGLIIGGPSLLRMGIIAGPEGLNLELSGVQFGSYSNEFWELGEISNNLILESWEGSESNWLASVSGKVDI